MGLNKPVDFSTAKLLKEKGFDEQCLNFYTNPRCKMFGIDEHGRYYHIKNKSKNLWVSGNAATLDSKYVYYAPTIAEVIMWLYEKHGIWIYSYSVAPFIAEDEDYPKIVFVSKVQKFKEFDRFIDTDNGLAINHYNSPTEAYEAAIEYTLTRLI